MQRATARSFRRFAKIGKIEKLAKAPMPLNSVFFTKIVKSVKPLQSFCRY
jgi:hypothetical protein